MFDTPPPYQFGGTIPAGQRLSSLFCFGISCLEGLRAIEAYPGFDLQPAVLSALDGSLSLAWMANHNPSGGITSNFNILYATRLSNGTWLPPSFITIQGGTNQMPSLAQTSNGTIYLFWSYQATGSTHSQIYYRTLKAGTWSAYTQVTSTTS